jgi:hypothetical protein
MKGKPILQTGTDKVICRHVCDRYFASDSLTEINGKMGLKYKPDRNGGLVWYTDGCMTNKGTGSGIYGYDMRKKLSFSHTQYTTVFQTEVYVTKA